MEITSELTSVDITIQQLYSYLKRNILIFSNDSGYFSRIMEIQPGWWAIPHRMPTAQYQARSQRQTVAVWYKLILLYSV